MIFEHPTPLLQKENKLNMTLQNITHYAHKNLSARQVFEDDCVAKVVRDNRLLSSQTR